MGLLKDFFSHNQVCHLQANLLALVLQEGLDLLPCLELQPDLPDLDVPAGLVGPQLLWLLSGLFLHAAIIYFNIKTMFNTFSHYSVFVDGYQTFLPGLTATKDSLCFLHNFCHSSLINFPISLHVIYNKRFLMSLQKMLARPYEQFGHMWSLLWRMILIF